MHLKKIALKKNTHMLPLKKVFCSKFSCELFGTVYCSLAIRHNDNSILNWTQTKRYHKHEVTEQTFSKPLIGSLLSRLPFLHMMGQNQEIISVIIWNKDFKLLQGWRGVCSLLVILYS